MLLGPRPDRGELARGPHERADDRPVVGAVGVDAVAGRHDVVEAEPVGQRLDEVVRRRGRQHDRPPGGPVLLEDRPGERLDHRRQPVGGGFAGRLHSSARGRPLARVAPWRAITIDGSVSPSELNRP